MSGPTAVSKTAIACLWLQHSSRWGPLQRGSDRIVPAEFAVYLFLITLYPLTLLPASLLGLSITVSTVLASTSIGHKVDTEHRFLFVRKLVVIQKAS
ncbi:hypothetical protein QFC20_003834 [Naganishia adeliensis]|uniref:Uncharacterized protein n=1 Tax=Naganishia adeliensis TaxID=92952 RepID=A0ACC2W5U6_9TREE|nr:hypothetical protein QFC20_003834 [Naganishia adeliensis]